MKFTKSIVFAVVMVATVLIAGCSARYETVKGDPLGAKIYTLDNGLKVYMSVNKEKPRIQTYIAVRSGGKNDPDSLQEILDETEKRIDKVTRDREGIVNSENRLSKLSKDIDSKFNVLEDITKAETSKKTTKSSSITPRKRENVKTLKQQGWRVEEIADKLKLTESEVQLILDTDF